MLQVFPVRRIPYTALIQRLALLFLYVGLALGTTWPLARFPATRLPLGTEAYATVPLFNVWTIWWNADRLRHGFSGYWDAPIFHPHSGTFAWSEPEPVTLAVAPVIWLTGSRVLGYNLYLWGSLVLNGLMTQRLLRTLGCGWFIAVSGAAAMVLLPLVHWQRDVIQLIPLWGILWTWTALLRIARRATTPRGVELGLAFGVVCLTCVHQGLFAALLLAGTAVTLWKRWRTLRLWRSLAVAVLVATAITAPIIIPLRQTLARNQFTRSQESVAALSAQPGDYTTAFGRQWLNFGHVAARPEWPLSAGWIKYGLALLGAGFGLLRRRWRWWTSFLLVTATLAFALSLGANLRFGAWQPYWGLMNLVPGLSHVRNVFRLAFFVQLATVLLACQALYLLRVVGRRCRFAKTGRRACWTVLAVLAGLFVFEVVPTAPQLAAAPDESANAGWISFVRDHTPRGRAIACVPFAPGDTAADFDMTTRWMYFATFHEARLVNGYSGFFPLADFELRRIINQAFPSEESLARLAGANVDLVVCQRTTAAPQPLRPGPYGHFRLDHAFADPIGIDVYRLTTSDP